MGGQPCYYKLLMDGARAQSNVRILMDFVERVGPDAIKDDEGYRIVEHLNASENAIDKATAEFIKMMGWDGPLPHSLTFKEYTK